MSCGDYTRWIADRRSIIVAGISVIAGLEDHHVLTLRLYIAAHRRA